VRGQKEASVGQFSQKPKQRAGRRERLLEVSLAELALREVVYLPDSVFLYLLVDAIEL
jgi:hypothetical protein